MIRALTAAGVALLMTGALLLSPAPADASVCGSVGGRHVDVTGCADPFSYLNQALATPPPPPPPEAPPPGEPPPPVYVPPPDLTPNVEVCVNAGRRINVSACR